MAFIHPFKAVRPTPEKAHLVASAPYDVTDYAETKEITDANPYSFLHIGRAEVDLPEGTDPHSSEVYKKAAENLQKFINDGILIQDNEPCLYIYRLSKGSHTQTGIACCTSVDEYLEGKIKKHELTRTEKESDRINHITACNAHTGPVFLAYKGNKNETVENFAEKNAPLYTFESDGVTHTVWKISNAKTIAEIKEFFISIDSLYIADGHHRAASAAKAALKKREYNTAFSGNEEYSFFLSVIFPSEQLQILDYNRTVKDLNGMTEDEFLSRVKGICEVTECPKAFRPEKPRQFGMFLGQKWYSLNFTTYNSHFFNTILDTSLLYETLLKPILAVENQRTDKRLDFVGGIRGLEELEKRVLSGNAAVAFSLFPTSVDELISVADKGDIMPPKSTWFEPKLKSGLFIHKID